MLKNLYGIGYVTIFLVSVWNMLLMSNAHAERDSLQQPPTKLLVWGDSLSAAYGIPVKKGWVTLLQNKLGNKIKINNASISGETTQGGLTRLPQALEKYQPDIMLLELGANDGLRGIRLEVMEKNLEQMITLAKQKKVQIVLLGIKIPPNYGMDYSKKFEQIFVDLANKHQLNFVPFILKDIADDYDLMQEDGIHPTATAQVTLLNNVLPTLNKTLLVLHKADKKEKKNEK